MARLFVAIQVPALKRLVEVHEALRRLRPQVRPVHPDLLHLTLRFLGDVPLEGMPAVEHAVRALGDVPGLAGTIRFTGLGRFPHVVYARAEPAAPLQAMADALDASLSGRDKPFTAHLTLARLRGRVRRAALDAAMEPYEDADLGSVAAKEVHLIESRLGGPRPTYVSLLTQRLRDAR